MSGIQLHGTPQVWRQSDVVIKALQVRYCRDSRMICYLRNYEPVSAAGETAGLGQILERVVCVCICGNRTGTCNSWSGAAASGVHISLVPATWQAGIQGQHLGVAPGVQSWRIHIVYKYEHVLLQDINPDQLERRESGQAAHAVHVCVKAMPFICANPYGFLQVCTYVHTCVCRQLL